MADEEKKDVTEEELPEEETPEEETDSKDSASVPNPSPPEEPEADASEDTDDEDEESTPARRGSAETTTEVEHTTSEAPRDAEGTIVVRASARYVRSAPRKARLVMDHIRGKKVQDAVAMLNHTPRAASRDVLKLLNSAVANAENNHELAADELRVHRATVDEGPTIKRYQPRAQGRATPIHKRTSHMTITLTTESKE